ncbi:ribbon-helix-helix protein, CopG family [Alloscardovia venturai]|uniref:Ribbon-helix-helix protein, CopG family n=1 Tax=Alloscardovia venturai TaxID=1769421 RepID=A0ABW2Y542_9BIFI
MPRSLVKTLDEHAKRYHVSRSEYIRRKLAYA